MKKAPSVGALDDAREKAEGIRARIVKGEAFEKVAAEVSDSPSKANGGLIGPISRDEMNEELLKMLATMKVGDITPVMNTADRRAVLQAGIIDRLDDAAVRSGARADCRQAAGQKIGGGDPEIHAAASRVRRSSSGKTRNSERRGRSVLPPSRTF